MQRGAQALSDEQQAQAALFQEVTASNLDTAVVAQLLESCNWDLDQAIQLHMAAIDEEAARGPAAMSFMAPVVEPDAGSPRRQLGAPLLIGQGGAAIVRPAPQAHEPPPAACLQWFMRGFRTLSHSVVTLVRTFLFGGGARGMLWSSGSGAGFRNALLSLYGSHLRLPHFFDGTFQSALEAARGQSKLLVVYLNSSDQNMRESQAFCSNILGNPNLSSMLDRNFLLWGGDMSRREPQVVARVVGAVQFPSFSVILPASHDDVRVIGAMTGDMELDSVMALLTACNGDMETHQSEMVARNMQHSEDRYLRDEQDREYQQALEMDRKAAEAQRLREGQEREEQRKVEERVRKETDELEKIEMAKKQVQDGRRRSVSALMPEDDPEATARVALRLPGGQRLQRKFKPTATLAELYLWAEVAAHLPENQGKGLQIPERFKLTTSMPARDLDQKERTVEELKLSGTNILLTGLDD